MTHDELVEAVKGLVVVCPSRDLVQSIKVGSLVVDCFGGINPVVEIYGRGDDLNGRAYVCFYTQLSETSKVSGSYKEGRLEPTLPITNRLNSWECDELERYLNKISA